MTLEELYKEIRSTLSEADARYVLQKRANITHADLIASPEQVVEEAIVDQITSDIEKHRAGLPLSRLYGEREFWGMSFQLVEATLDPRPDTETLIEAVVKRYRAAPPKRILDLGTGTGCILVSLLSEFPEATGLGVDLSEQAVETAKLNAEKNHVGDRAVFSQGNWTESIHESFDLIVSNPPYIRANVIQNLDESVKKHDPILALEGGEDGLQAYKEIFSDLFRVLKPSGRAFFEIGFDQEESTRRLSEESRFSVISTYADLSGHIRVIEIAPKNDSGDK